MSSLLIKKGRVIDPSQNLNVIADLLIEDGIVKGVAKHISKSDAEQVIEADGLIVCPGFIDLHCHLREPGFEYKETIATGTAAAARGGFTTICAMPNTRPVSDTRATVDFVLHKAQDEGVVRVLPIGCVTDGSRGKVLVEMGELAESGVIGFSDDGYPVDDANIMRQALSYSSSLGLPIINHCEERELSAGGLMNEGWISNRLGLTGIPGSAEEVMVARDIALAELTKGRLHVAHASTGGTLDLVRAAKDKGVTVTCEVTPHHLTLTDESVMGHRKIESAFDPLGQNAYDSNAKVAPPLRSSWDVDAMVQGLKDGVIDFIATDHAPHGQIDKLCTFEEAAFGISVLETALGSVMALVHSGAVPLSLLISKLTEFPARFLDRHDLGTLKVGTTADVTIFNADAEWTVDAASFVSKGKNTPLDGAILKGQTMVTIVEGVVVYQNEDAKFQTE